MRRLPLLFVLALFAPLAVWSQALSSPQPLAPAAPDPRAPLFVSVGWLAQHRGEPDIVLLHVGDPRDYAATHIAGARLVSVRDVSVGDPTGFSLSVEMPSADTLRERLAALGISDGSRVVVYFAKDWTYQATRILFTLYRAGLGDRASLLDGGMGAWTAAGHETTADVPAPRTGALSPLAIQPFVVDGEWVRSMLGRPGVAIVDARDTVFYSGSRTGGSATVPHATGHIPGALSVPYTTLFDEALRIRPTAELARAFAEAGVKAGDVVVGYCHTGQQATALLTMARALGHPVLLYDGSFQDWSRRANVQVETGTKKPKD